MKSAANFSHPAGGSAGRDSLRSRLESTLVEHWYPADGRKTWLAWLLLPLAGLFALLVRRRYTAARLKLDFSRARNINAVVVVVGNISVGGTGKTPLLLKLASDLVARGYRVAVLSKGYRSAHLRGAGGPRRVLCNDSSDEVGDEPLMLARALAAIEPATPVVICKQRNEGLAFLLEGAAPDAGPPLDVVLSDDGLQHYALPRDLEYVVVDGQRGFGNRCLLPAGPLREPVARLALADRIVINGSGEQARQLTQACPVARELCASMCVSASTARRLYTASEPRDDSPASNNGRAGPLPLAGLLSGLDTVIAITGTGNPARFFTSIAQHVGRARLITAAFADHHAFVAADFTRVVKQHGLDASPGRIAFLVTEKDAVKCSAFASQVSLPIYAVGIEVELSSSALQPVLDACVQLQAWRAASASA